MRREQHFDDPVNKVSTAVVPVLNVRCGIESVFELPRMRGFGNGYCQGRDPIGAMSKPFMTSDDELSAAEEALLACAAKGETADLAGAEVRGIVVRALINGSRPDWPVAVSGVRISNAVFAGGLDLEGCSVSVPVLLSGVRIAADARGAVIIRDARLKRLGLQKCQLDGPLVADRAQVDNGILVAGGQIAGQLTARGAQVGGALAVEGTVIGDGREAIRANGVRLSGPLILRRTRLKGDVQLARSELGSGIYADQMTVEGNACGFDVESARIDGDFLAADARISGGLRLSNARLGGRLEGRGLSVSATQTAIEAGNVNIGQGLNLVDARVMGSIVLDGAEIGKGFIAEGVEVEGGATAISAGGIAVEGNWDLARSKLVGALNFPGAVIRGQLRLTEARLFGAELAIRGDGAQIRGGCYMSRSIIFGLIRFPACDIGNQFRLRGASLKVESGAALMVNGSRFGRDVELNDGLQAIGALVLDQVRIPGVLDFSGSHIKSAALARNGRPAPDTGDQADAVTEWDEAAISIADADVKRLCMPSVSEQRPRGVVDFSRARAASYHDFAETWPPGVDGRGRALDGRDIDHLILDGFIYEHLNNPSGAKEGGIQRHSRADDRVGEQRLVWLEGQQACDIRDHFKPQPWVQLEKRLVQQGYDEDSRKIAIARMRRERNSHATRTLHRWQGGFLDLFALYGFNPWRTVAWMCVFILVFAGLWAWAGGQCEKPGCHDESVFVMTNRDAYSPEAFDQVYPEFNPLAYSFDVFVPFVSFGYADHWRPNLSWQPLIDIPQPITFAPIEDKPGATQGAAAVPKISVTLGGLIYVGMILETIVGLVLTSLLITGFTGLLRGE